MKLSKSLIKTTAFIMALAISNPAFSWTRELTFESESIGAKATGTSLDFDDAAGGSYITDEQVLRGEKAAKLTVTGGSTAFGEWGGIVNFPTALGKGDEIWFSVNTFFPEGFNYDSTGEGGHLKFLRIHTSTPSGDNRGYNDWYINPENSSIPHKFICECQARWFDYGTRSDRIQRGQWESYEMYVKFDNIPTDEGGTAIVRVWKDGRLLREITGAKTLGSSGDVSTRAHLFTYWNGAAPKSQFMYVDDIIITSDTPRYRDSYGNPMATRVGVTSRPDAPDLSVE